ncbi:MAG TPA: HrpE/YscL family type III secretion apparatus protein [Parachlamydiaceae bacterium]|nr:HrpE/YscL family type III secretion apparatus protein [Parachlamydiaceae bacterium]
MNKRFFSLIHGETVHVAPKVKFIPSGEFSTLLNAKDILEKAKEDAEKYKLAVTAECEQLKEEAEKIGFNKGFEAWAKELAKLENEIIRIRSDSEQAIIPIALKAAKKIVGKEIELSETTILNIVLNYLKAVSTHKKITIYVSKKDLAILENNRQRLKEAFESLEALSIRERPDIEPGGCIIETEGGIINAKLENQWEVIETAFKGLLKEELKTAKAQK